MHMSVRAVKMKIIYKNIRIKNRGKIILKIEIVDAKEEGEKKIVIYFYCIEWWKRQNYAHFKN